MIDEKDKQIIDILLESGREPASSISEKIGLSIPTVTDRIKKMIDSELFIISSLNNEGIEELMDSLFKYKNIIDD